MNILRKVLFIVLALVLLTALKHFLDKYSPVSIVFHYNLLTGLQYFLLFGLFTWLLVQAVARITKKRYLKTVYCVIIFLVIMAGAEGYLYYMFRHAEKTDGRFHDLISQYYLTYELNYPKLTYDSILSYTLEKNSVYQHSNIEFSNEIRANSIGLRDDEASLSQPDVICLGDSYTMGWGVDNKKSFPELIEQGTGLKTLNAGMTSYGTARELLLLNRLDTSNLKYLVIQYYYNDGAENAKFLENKRYLPIGTQKTMDFRFTGHELARKYFPFKYSLTLARMYLRDRIYTRRPTPGDRPLNYVSQDANAFLQILSKANINFNKVKVIITDINRYPSYDHHFLDTVQNLVTNGEYADDFIRSLRIIKFPKLNDQRYFFPLDNHLNEAGHALIATNIIAAIKNSPSQ